MLTEANDAWELVILKTHVCPCGCGKVPESGKFYFDREHARKANKMGIRMPKKRSEFERILHDKRTRKVKHG